MRAANRQAFARTALAGEAIGAARVVTVGTVAEVVVLCGASDTALGISLGAAASGEGVEYTPAGRGDAVRVTTAGAIAAGAEFVAAADGAIGPVPTEGGGTADKIGRLDPDSAAATAAGQVVVARLYDTPVTVTVAT